MGPFTQHGSHAVTQQHPEDRRNGKIAPYFRIISEDRYHDDYQSRFTLTRSQGDLSKRIVGGISGASGVVYGIRMLEVLKTCQEIETHLILANGGITTMRLETSWEPQQVEALADYSYSQDNLASPLSSGSFKTDGMIVAPCSMKSLSMIAYSFNENLLVRAADVTLKERRKLVLVPRETPLHLGHLRAMIRVTKMGGTILPPIPAFYHRPGSIDDIIDQTVGKAFDQFDIPHQLFNRWGGG